MADIQLNVNGDSSGASGALREAGGAVGELGEDVGKSVVKWQEFANITKQAVEMVVRFGVDAVKAYAESERVQKQLTRAAGDYADALSDQAEALSRKYAVDDDIIKQSQILLTQWGGVGAATEDVTKAVLNYASATGQDAVAATSDLIRNVESGGAGLAKMGVHFEATGDKGKDLAAAIAAINAKFGGAAVADADSLVGQTHAATLAFEDLQKNLGGAIAEMVRASGVVPRLTKEIRDLTDSLFTPTATKQEQSQEYIAQQVKYWEDITAGNVIGYKDFATKTQFSFEEAQANLAEWRAKLRPDDFNLNPKSGPTVTGETNAGRKDREASQKEAQTKAAAHAKKMEEIERKNIEEFQKFQKQWDEVDARAKEAQEKTSREMLKRLEDASFEVWDTITDNEKESADKLAKAFMQVSEDTTKYIESQEKAWADAGTTIGVALVNSVSDQLDRLMSGEDLDAGEAIANVVGDVLAVAGQAIGAVVGGIYGGAGGTQIGGAIGGAVGGLAGSGVKALGRAGKTKKYHEGGWIGDEAELPRYHDGSWIGTDERRAILQTGERVLSRTEVSRAGGPDAVDAMAGGAPRFSISIQTMDSMGVRQFFENQGGRGFYNALRTGRGSLRPAFGGG